MGEVEEEEDEGALASRGRAGSSLTLLRQTKRRILATALCALLIFFYLKL